jgi:Zn finger protein HypA/HybF involved in hydrogenase expression
MEGMTWVITALSVILGMLGLLFVIGSQGQVGRLLIGALLLAAAIALMAALRLRPRTTTFVQKIDLTGDVSAQELKCKSCGGTLTNESVAVRGGAIFISCEFCGTEYQLEEEAKW